MIEAGSIDIINTEVARSLRKAEVHRAQRI